MRRVCERKSRSMGICEIKPAFSIVICGDGGGFLLAGECGGNKYADKQTGYWMNSVHFIAP